MAKTLMSTRGSHSSLKVDGLDGTCMNLLEFVQNRRLYLLHEDMKVITAICFF